MDRFNSGQSRSSVSSQGARDRRGSQRGMAARQVTVGAVDDHPAMLEGISNVLSRRFPDLAIVRCAQSVDALLTAGDACDVVLLDLRLDDGSRPLDNVSRLLAAGSRVLVFTQGDDSDLTREALRAGALGVVHKSESGDVLADAVRTVAAGETVLSQRLAAALEGAPSLPASLSERERDVLRLYASNLPAKSVARRLGITEGTVKEYLKRIRAKYAELHRPAGTKLDLYHRALEDGVLDETAQ
jgi:DNA-binding NarL/FixJ family response regulator